MEVGFFNAHILSVKTVIGQNKLTVKLRLNTLFRLVEVNVTPFEYIKLDRPFEFSRTYGKSNMAREEVGSLEVSSLFCKNCCQN